MSRKFKRQLSQNGNLMVIIVGILLFIIGISNTEHATIQALFFGIGGSLIATGIGTWLTSFYTISREETEEIISDWRLKQIFETKQAMNDESNKCLNDAVKQIDIVAVGMTGYLSYKGSLLEEKLKKGVAIRIISCDNLTMLEQREADESSNYSPQNDKMKGEVTNLSNWVSRNKKIGNINIKYHSSYPGFSYLRIDDTIFFGPNLPKYMSQTNMAFSFDIAGQGGKYLSNYFEKLWNDELICSEQLNFDSIPPNFKYQKRGELI